MANAEHLAILRDGVEAWNDWRMANPKTAVDLEGAALDGANMRGANLNEADLSRAELTRADLRQADLRKANLGHARLNLAFLEGADLSRAILDGADLRHGVLYESIAKGASLIRTNLRHADLSHADLTRANLSEADLHDVNLAHSNLANANLSGVTLTGAHFERGDLFSTNLGNTRMGGTVFIDLNLGLASGLESVRHVGPSTIGIDTLYRSKAKIPEVFLRDAGVPESLITYAKSIFGSAIEYYSLFISYSTADQGFAERLYADLQAKGIRCWFAPHNIQGGKKIHEQIDEAIRLYDKLLLILSPKSMESEWVKTEISKARKRELRDKARVLFPVRLVPFERLRDWECFDADTGKDSAREIREYFVPDFSNWKDHDSYRTAFDRLVKDLQAPVQNG